MKHMRKLRLPYGVLASVILGMVIVMVVRLFAAIPGGGVFELDGNPTVDNAPADDWANTVPPPPGASSEALASTFVADGSGNATIFTTGGSKDINDISQWQFKDQLGGLPDKDNITNAFAAAYVVNGQLTLFFGADRFANDGDAQMGFWFFQKRVQAINGQFVGADGVTPAVHSVGDILVLANLTNGGATVTAQVFEWVGGSNPLLLLQNDVDAKCGSNADPNVCAISNPGGETVPWSYTPKSGPTGIYPTFSFIEGGINISGLLGGNLTECFSSFLAETRSSQSPSATLKDFALGEFNTCKVDISKTCDTVTFNQQTGKLDYAFHVTVTNSGIAPLFDVTVTDTAVIDTSTQQKDVQTLPPFAGPLTAGASHTFDGTISITPGPNAPNPPTDSATATANTVSGGGQGNITLNAGPATATCPSVTFAGDLTITKTCATRLEVANNRVSVAVDISGQVCVVTGGAGSLNSPFDNVQVTDSPAITPSPIDLGSIDPGQCKNYSATYLPNILTNGSVLAKDQTYTDTATVTGTRRFDSAQKVNTKSATCPLCQ